jgi:hypothetical protein
VTQAMNKPTTDSVSSKYKPTAIGRIVSNPAICRRNPRLA